MGAVQMEAQTVQLSAPLTAAIILRTSAGAPANGRAIACCIFIENKIKPSVEANDSCKPTLAMAYGLTANNIASAASSASRLFARLRAANPPAAARYISAARSTDGVAPAMGTNSSTSGTDTYVPHRLPSSSVQNPTRKPICSPETAVRWLRPAMRNAVRSSSLMRFVPPTSRPLRSPASRSGSASCTACRQNRAIRCGRKRRLSRRESSSTNTSGSFSSSSTHEAVT